MELSDYRAQIDRIDAELLRLFAERMQTAAGIAAYKKEHALPVLRPRGRLLRSAPRLGRLLRGPGLRGRRLLRTTRLIF